jgi:sugar lactone lactonase YvrE
MKTTTLHLLAGLVITTTAVCGKTIPNNATADLVLGQQNFTTATFSAITASSLDHPEAITIDPASGKVFVADANNNRVLRYASAAALQNGSAAEAVFGQPDFTTKTANSVGSLGMNYPCALFFDRLKRLWVADRGNHRVLMFTAADIRETQAHPDKVFGQPDFSTTASAAASATKMKDPSGVWLDKDDRLWVADQNFNRILRFDSVSNNPAVNSAADGVIGQPNFTTTAVGLGPDRFDNPESVTVSAAGQLYVADYANSRVLRFDNAATASGLVNAAAVLGQVNFTTGSADTTATTLRYPAGVFITPDDQLWVTDFSNRRMLRFNNASTKANGAAADGFLGQPDFTTSSPGLSAQKLVSPYYAPFVDAGGSLWVPDTGNNRVLRFSPDATPPLLTVTAPGKITKKPKLTFKGTASDTYGIAKVEYRVNKGPLKLATGTTAWSFTTKLLKGKNTFTILATDVDGIQSLSKVIKITRK